MQNDLNNLIRRADNYSWQLKLNYNKFHVIHVGHEQSNVEYYLDMCVELK